MTKRLQELSDEDLTKLFSAKWEFKTSCPRWGRSWPRWQRWAIKRS